MFDTGADVTILIIKQSDEISQKNAICLELAKTLATSANKDNLDLLNR